MDDYRNRGPMIDFASYGAYTWTSRPTQTFQDGKWGYFSGTSCAAPVAAGCATVFIEHYFTQRGVYPSIAKLKEIMVQSAKETLIGEGMEGIDFSNVAGSRATPPAIYPAGNVASSKLYCSSIKLSNNSELFFNISSAAESANLCLSLFIILCLPSIKSSAIICSVSK